MRLFSNRSSGVLLHLSSLPGPHGVGDLGKDAHRFASQLRDARQSWWQMFPLGPPGMSNSPYQTLSAFAGNPLFIDLNGLYADGLLQKSDLRGNPSPTPDKVSFGSTWTYKKLRLRKAFAIFEFHRKNQHPAFESFVRREASWLDDYALYCAIKAKHRGDSWEKWGSEYRLRKPSALKFAASKLKLTVRYHQFLQYKFFQQWTALKKTCAKNGVGLIGDIPIFVAHDSADVWANQQYFWLDKNGSPSFVAGCPPDYFSRTGQRWGNPLYHWDKLRRDGYDWWIRRIQTLFELVDAARIDHFIGFRNYWRIPATHKTAERGKWITAPGDDFFEKVFKRLGRIPLIAEDLGAITPAVAALRDKFRLPGMRILQFAFNGDPKNLFLPQNFIKNTVVFTGTHDNDTTVGWFRGLKAKDRAFVEKILGRVKEINWDLIRLAQSSVANTAIVPMQDLLGLDSRARMNLPGTSQGNWRWRLKPGQFTPKIRRRLAKLTETYGRC